MRIASALALVLTAASVAARPVATPDPATIKSAVIRRGAKPVVDDLYRSGAWWRVRRRIAGGAPRWVALARPLAPGTDAATAESLGDALTKALPRSPEAVLAAVDPSGRLLPLAPATVCSASFFEGDRTDPVRYRARAIRAVSAVRAPTLAAARRACLERLRDAG